MANGEVTISAERYVELLGDSRFLAALEAAGVDNWEGYNEALRIRDEGQG